MTSARRSYNRFEEALENIKLYDGKELSELENDPDFDKDREEYDKAAASVIRAGILEDESAPEDLRSAAYEWSRMANRKKMERAKLGRYARPYIDLTKGSTEENPSGIYPIFEYALRNWYYGDRSLTWVQRQLERTDKNRPLKVPLKKMTKQAFHQMLQKMGLRKTKRR